jgi:hypothetical protein
MDLEGIGSESVDWIHLVLDRTRRGVLEHGNELPGSVKGDEFLEYLRYCWLLKKCSAPWS